MDGIRTEILLGINQNEIFDYKKEEKHINLAKRSDFFFPDSLGKDKKNACLLKYFD